MKDTLRNAGSLALASRCRRLFERLFQDTTTIYKTTGVDFKPTWFPIFLALKQQEPLAMSQLADQLGVTHVAINLTVKELTSHGLVKAHTSASDKRVRKIELTETGRNLLEKAEKVWPLCRVAINEAIQEAQADIIRDLDRLEDALDRKSFLNRFRDQWTDGIEIIPYNPSLAEHFYTINAAWIETYFVMEEPDRKALKNPQEKILAPGGTIIFARDRITGEILGTCALIRQEDKFELAKMGVLEAARGRGIGTKLGVAILKHAASLGATQVYLETNSGLQTAINLYRKLGFVQTPHPFPSEYARADVYMIADLKELPYERTR